jgi:F-type H+-transporting ATPase subunit a
MNTVLLRLTFVLLAMSLAAGSGFAQGHGGQGATAKSTRDMQNNEFFTPQFEHLEPHSLWGPTISPDPAINEKVLFYNVNLFQLIALGLIVVLFVPVLWSFQSQRSNVVVRVFRGWVHWLRDEVVYSLMGKEDGEKFAPYFVFLFFFIAFMNLLGLIPGSATATATVFVTGALAALTFVMMIVGGMLKQGPIDYVKHLLPSGLPMWLVPLMAVVELVGLFVKPFALMIRLFANMLAGHLLIYSFIGMIFVFAKMMDLGVFSWAAALPTVGMAVFINIIEAFVVLLQAYIFLYLSVLFVQESLHPAH